MKGNMFLPAISAMFALILVAGGASAFDVWNAADQYDLVHNPNALYPWRCGAGTGSQFRLSTSAFSSNGLAGWQADPDHYPDVKKNVTGANIVWNLVGENGLIPKGALTISSDFTTAETGTLRWTAPYAGWFRVDCSFTGVYQFTGTGYHPGTNANAYVFVQGVSVFSKNVVNHGTAAFHNTFSLAAGSKIDFAVDYGPDGYADWDRLILDATISQVPEPATLGLLAAGGLAMLRRRRRR